LHNTQNAQSLKSGLKERRYGYEILELYEVEEWYSLEMKERGWIKGPPQKYLSISKDMLEGIPLESLKKVFRNARIPET